MRRNGIHGAVINRPIGVELACTMNVNALAKTDPGLPFSELLREVKLRSCTCWPLRITENVEYGLQYSQLILYDNLVAWSFG